MLKLQLFLIQKSSLATLTNNNSVTFTKTVDPVMQIISLPNNPMFSQTKKMTFKSIEGKGENAGYQHIFCFPK